MIAAFKLDPVAQATEKLSQKPPLGEKRPKLRLVWENPRLSAGSHKEKPEAKPGASYGRVHYNMHRTYDPATGRYLEADPLGIIPGLTPTPLLSVKLPGVSNGILQAGLNHSYAYVSNNPLRWIDPLGLYPECSVYPPGSGLRAICENTPNSQSTACVRECLSDYYPIPYPDEGSSCGLNDGDPYFEDNHEFCWSYCGFPITNLPSFTWDIIDGIVQ